MTSMSMLSPYWVISETTSDSGNSLPLTVRPPASVVIASCGPTSTAATKVLPSQRTPALPEMTLMSVAAGSSGGSGRRRCRRNDHTTANHSTSRTRPRIGMNSAIAAATRMVTAAHTGSALFRAKATVTHTATP
ncbi:hypothetical protein [Mycolicibacterium sp. GF69]|uniref:hypothetical protein n=1 Tax=Mycolicibacterium sp. GF69 TaxID=2267251 RepID=UPI0014021ED3|nr:hypothetical protein [Mycolicibacterium sp. GF69]